MSTENFSSKIGHSPSPVVERVIENNTNVQQDYKTPQAAIDNAFNKHPVADIGTKQ
jgi:hypothetical protein